MNVELKLSSDKIMSPLYNGIQSPHMIFENPLSLYLKSLRKARLLLRVTLINCCPAAKTLIMFHSMGSGLSLQMKKTD